MRYEYRIAGQRVSCRIPFALALQEESVDFIRAAGTKSESGADLKMVFQPVDRLENLPDGGHWEINQYHLETSRGRRVYHCSLRTQPPYACVFWPAHREDTVLCEYVRGKETYLNYSHNICDLLGLETLLLKYGGLLLHSSFIRWQGQGILFSAPSGTGKSTQADLWVKYEGAEVLNGDRAGLRRENGEWMAYGLPYAGSSAIYRNESAPAKAVIVLRQGKTNEICRLRPAQAFGALYPETANHTWDRTFVEKVTEYLYRLIMEVPVYQLTCLPDKGAVQVLKETLSGISAKGD